MLMDYEIFLIFIPTKIWSLVSNSIYFSELLFSDDNLDQQSIDRAFAESLDTNSVTRESEMLSIESKSNI